MKQYAIYTAIVGGYDNILQPLVSDERFDYILFSNDITDKRVGVWQVRTIPYHNDTQTKIARWVKTHPEMLLPEYSFSLWIDGNIQIITDYPYTHSIELFRQAIPVAAICHPSRDCAYQEAAVCSQIQIEKELLVIRWLRFLYKEHYPLNNGLCETGILFRTNSNIVRQFDALWWSCIEQFSQRDQFSFNYALWKTKIYCGYFLKEGKNVRNSEHFRRSNLHENTTNRQIFFSSHNYPFYYWYKKTYNIAESNTIDERLFHKYLTFSHVFSPILFARLFGLYYRILCRIRRK